MDEDYHQYLITDLINVKMESTQFVPLVNYNGEFSKAKLPRSLRLYPNAHFERIPYCILRLHEPTLKPLVGCLSTVFRLRCLCKMGFCHSIRHLSTIPNSHSYPLSMVRLLI
jgi:hypothetical protein